MAAAPPPDAARADPAPLKPHGGEELPPAPRYGVLLVAATVSIAVQGISSPGRIQQLVVTALSGATLVLAVRSAQPHSRVQRMAAALAAAALALAVLRAAGGEVSDGAARAMNAALIAFGPPAVAIGVLRDLRATGRVRVSSVLGVLSLYLLMGLLFAFVFGAVAKVDNTPPLFADGQAPTVSRCIYFSFITLTTVGYGDVTTQTQLGHTLSVFEALIGQIYLVTVVSLLVSNVGRRPRGGIGG